MLKIQNILKHFPGNDVPVLNNLNLDISTGEFVIVLGSNGSGKSTLLKCISGEYEISSGNIILDNLDITGQKIYQRAKNISFVSQDTAQGTATDMTVLENMCLSMNRGAKSHFKFYNNKKHQIKTLISASGINLDNVIDKKMSLLSGGQRQAISTLMAIYPVPQLLLLDEHTSALDPRSSQQLMEYTNKIIGQNNITTIMVTHNIEDAMKYGNRLLIMHHGNIIHDIKTKQKKQLTKVDILDMLNNNASLG